MRRWLMVDGGLLCPPFTIHHLRFLSPHHPRSTRETIALPTITPLGNYSSVAGGIIPTCSASSIIHAGGWAASSSRDQTSGLALPLLA